LSQGRAPPTAVILEAKESRTRALQKKERAMAMFEGVDRNRNIIISVVVVVVVVAVLYYLYAGGHLSGII
jgi:hypothetical protein